MRSRFLQEIINETPQVVDIRVRKWADDMKRAARYEARRGAYHKRLVSMELRFGNFKRDQMLTDDWLFSEQDRNYEQQEID